MNWSEEQTKVISSRNGNLLVSAAAGSGKTAVLVERIVTMITDPDAPVSLDELLVMTFTRAAAEEMRERIGRAIAKRIGENPDNPQLRLQYAILPRARIATIDAVCQSLIRQYYQDLDIDPGFTVAEESDLRLLRADILKDLLEEKYQEGNADFMLLQESYARRGMDERLSALTERLFSFSESCPWPNRWFKEQLAVCAEEMAGNLSGLSWMRDAIAFLQAEAADHAKQLERALGICREPDGPQPYEEAILQSWEDAQRLLSLSDYDAWYEAVSEITFPSFKRINKKLHNPDKAEFVKAARDDFKKFITVLLQKKLMVLPPDVLREAVAGSARCNRALLLLTMEFSGRFADAKKERNQVDFSDLEHDALRLLYTEQDGKMLPSPLADQLAGELKEIMIDEYQDSNGVQEALLQALSAERFGRPDIFMVGDIKQSIYGFRQADPGLFLQKLESYQKGGDHQRIELNLNFRSRRQILDTVNAVFTPLMRRDLGGVEYDERHRLYPGASYPDKEEAETEFLLLDPDTEEELEEENEELEYRMIAKRILELVQPDGAKEPYPVYDASAGRSRPAEFRDMVVLMRAAKGHAEKLVDILASCGIPAYFHNSTGYFSAPEVRTMLAALSVIDNPRQDIPLTAVMLSPVGGFTEEETARIRIAYDAYCREQAKEPEDFYDALLYCAKDDPKCDRFLSWLRGMREAADILPVHLILARIYRETGYYAYASALPMGQIRKRNLDMLLTRAENYMHTGYHGLFQFARYIEMLKKYETEYGEAGAGAENENLVRVMTIHGSKGLEFPIVFLARTAAPPVAGDRENGVLIHQEIGIASDFIRLSDNIRCPNLKKGLIRELTAGRETGEQLRLLYVAMTRAREKLILTGTMKRPLERLESLRMQGITAGGGHPDMQLPRILIRRYRTYADWIFLSLGENPAHIRIRVLPAGGLNLAAAGGGNVKSPAKDRILTDPGAASPDPVLFERLSASFAARYPYEEETGLRPKISVSEIKLRSFSDTGTDYDDGAGAAESYFADEWSSFPPDAQEDARGEVKETAKDGAELWGRKQTAVSQGAKRGTAFHRVMELLRYEGSAEDELRRIAADGRMSEADLTLVNPAEVERFLHSSLGREMKTAAESGQLYREQHFMIGRPADTLTPGVHSKELQLLQGIIDAYIEEEKEITLIDYKTDHVKTAKELTDHYRTQLELYADALTQLTGKPVSRRLIYSTCLGEVIAV